EARTGGTAAVGGAGGGGGGLGRIRPQQNSSCTGPGEQSPMASIACASCGTCAAPPRPHCKRPQDSSRTPFLCGDALSLQDARTRCQMAGADVVSIRDSATNDWLKGEITDHTWIGASDGLQDGTWQWLRDGALFWTGGSSGSPNAGAFANWA